MIKKKYYNILPNRLYRTNNIDLIADYLIEKNICERFISKSISGKFEKTDRLGEWSSKGQLYQTDDILIYSNKVVRELYTFLLTHYKAGLGDHITFNLKFYQDTFGLNFSESKKIALEYFNIYYNNISINPSFNLKIDDNRNIIPATNFESLKRHKEYLFLNLEKKSELIIPYLAGDNEYFNRSLFENNSMIREIFEFENNLKIILELNRKYQLEDDDIFTPKPKSKLIFEEYSNQFHSLKQIEFIVHQIESYEKVNRAFIISLFDFFSGSLKIKTPSAKLFGEIINEHFGFNFSEIGLNGSEGDKHRQRIETFKKDWEIFTN